MESEGRRLHGLAEQARESGDFTRALELTDQATVSYQQGGDSLGFAEVQASRFLTLRHLFEKTDDKNYLILAKHTAMASVELAQASGDKQALALPLFNLAKAQETLGELPDAVATYQKAVENIINNPPEPHKRAAIVADFKVHLETCAYKAGDKSALERAEKALVELEAVPVLSDEDFEAGGKKLEFNQEVAYNKDVWVSGGHMRIAEMLREDDPPQAKEHLQKAKEIIDANPQLKLRLAQWEKLATTFK
ncbi:hypothetical protein HY386_00670 [Candidatus Daviesbacteria bacterium]|nr:hypothetical protein [Candidatus Daviesbacteria bacterium]